MEIYTVYPWHYFSRLSKRWFEAKVRDVCPIFSAVTDWDQARELPMRQLPHPGTGSFWRQNELGPWRSKYRIIFTVLVPPPLVSVKRSELIVTLELIFWRPQRDRLGKLSRTVFKMAPWCLTPKTIGLWQETITQSFSKFLHGMMLYFGIFPFFQGIFPSTCGMF